SPFRHNVAGWGSFGQVLEENLALHEVVVYQKQWKFESQHISEGRVMGVSGSNSNTPLTQKIVNGQQLSQILLDFSEHMQNFDQYNTRMLFAQQVISLVKTSTLNRGRINGFPPALLVYLLHEELTYRREQGHFSYHATGGRHRVHFLYPHQNLPLSKAVWCTLGNTSDFHRVVLEFQEVNPPCFDASNKPLIPAQWSLC
ncbi:unnamed protein product, partial [Coregonus sp. 'balchen']